MARNAQLRSRNEVESSVSEDEVSYTMPLLTEDKMRRKLQFFFMNPIQKWQAKRRFPYKFMVQVIKIVLVTAQLCLFSYERHRHVNYTSDSTTTFAHLFLRGWEPNREIISYPPSTGPLAIYKKNEFFETIDYAYKGYSNLSDAIGPYSYETDDNTMPNMILCLSQYKEATIFGFNESYSFDANVVTSCYNILYQEEGELFKSERYFEDVDINFAGLVEARLSFSVRTVSLKSARGNAPPTCFHFNVSVIFNNEDIDGQLLLSLRAEPKRYTCSGQVEYINSANAIYTFCASLLNYFVVIICIVSFVLCCRAVWRAHQLKCITDEFFKKNYRRPLSSHDKLQFLNIWYIMIIINDILILVGSAMKLQIESGDVASDMWNLCSVFLGTGNMLVWFGVLRYLGFFKTYNVVILTLKKATPQVLRFLLCAMLIYAGFVFSGWVILGPYHVKFSTLTSTTECLYSLINGDDMFSTFSTMSHKSSLLWVYSRIYLYAFISLFIYVVLSLFISVIMDTYDTIKLYYKEGFPKSDIHAFIGDTSIDDLSSGIFRSNSNDSLGGLMKDLCCCAKLQKSYSTLYNPTRTTENEPNNIT